MRIPDCFVCEKHSRGNEAVGGVVLEDELSQAGHILPPDMTDVYLGYLMVEPKRHVPGLGDLTEEEAASLGRLVNAVGSALKAIEGAEHIYSLVLGDHVPHLHVHVIPRYPDTPEDYWGLRVGEWPGAPRGGPEEVAAVCDRLRQGLMAGRA